MIASCFTTGLVEGIRPEVSIRVANSGGGCAGANGSSCSDYYHSLRPVNQQRLAPLTIRAHTKTG